MSREMLASAVLEGLPPTVNCMYRTNGRSKRYKTPKAKAWTRGAVARLKRAWHGDPWEGDAEVRIVLHANSKRRWDIDNRVKAVLDAVQDAGVLKNDCQVQRLLVSRQASFESDTALTYVAVWTLEGGEEAADADQPG